MKKLLVLCSLVVMLIGLTGFNAAAAQMNGGISFSGNDAVDTGNLLTAKAFTSFSNVVVQSGSGTWAAVSMNTPASFTPFTFNPPANTPLWSFSFGGDTYSMSALGSTMTFTQATKNGIPELDVTGTGTITATGSVPFDPTPGGYEITAQQGGTTFSFSSSSVTTAAPEPGTLLLLGFGLVGLVGVARRRVKK